MGYPTSALATSRARTATGLSNVAVSQASSALRSAVGSVIQGAGFTSAPLPANWDIPGISQPTGKPPTPANIPGGSGVGPAPTGSPQPVGSPRPVGAPAPARPLPSPRSGPALPPYIRRQYREGGKPAYPPIARMYKDVYKNWDVVDAEAAVENLLINQIEDMVIGSVHSAIDRALGPVATTKWQNNPTKPQFEKDLAKAVNDVVEPIIRDLVDPEIDRGTAGQLGGLWDRLE